MNRQKTLANAAVSNGRFVSLVVMKDAVNYSQLMNLIVRLEVENQNCVSKQHLLHDLRTRDQIADTRIFDDFALPHCETNSVRHSRLIFVNCVQEKCVWFRQEVVKGVFFIILKSDETLTMRRKIQRSVSQLANPAVISELLDLHSLTELENVLHFNQKEIN